MVLNKLFNYEFFRYKTGQKKKDTSLFSFQIKKKKKNTQKTTDLQRIFLSPV